MKETTAVDATELLSKAKEIGIKEIIYTDIIKDGMMQALTSRHKEYRPSH